MHYLFDLICRNMIKWPWLKCVYYQKANYVLIQRHADEFKMDII